MLRRFSVVLWIYLFVFFCLCVQAAAEVTVVRSGMYREQPFVGKQSVFSLYDTFYCVFDVAGLDAGKHTMRADWITPAGILEQQSEYDFILDRSVSVHRLYSWLQVWENGPVTRLLTGRDFKRKFYGLWTVHIYIDGSRLAQQEFDAL